MVIPAPVDANTALTWAISIILGLGTFVIAAIFAHAVLRVDLRIVGWCRLHDTRLPAWLWPDAQEFYRTRLDPLLDAERRHLGLAAAATTLGQTAATPTSAPASTTTSAPGRTGGVSLPVSGLPSVPSALVADVPTLILPRPPAAWSFAAHYCPYCTFTTPPAGAEPFPCASLWHVVLFADERGLTREQVDRYLLPLLPELDLGLLASGQG